MIRHSIVKYNVKIPSLLSRQGVREAVEKEPKKALLF